MGLRGKRKILRKASRPRLKIQIESHNPKGKGGVNLPRKKNQEILKKGVAGGRKEPIRTKKVREAEKRKLTTMKSW